MFWNLERPSWFYVSFRAIILVPPVILDTRIQAPSFGVQNKVFRIPAKNADPGILPGPIKLGRFHKPKVSFRTKRSVVPVSRRSCNAAFIIVCSETQSGNGPLNAVVGTIPKYIPRRNIAREDIDSRFVVFLSRQNNRRDRFCARSARPENYEIIFSRMRVVKRENVDITTFLYMLFELSLLLCTCTLSLFSFWTFNNVEVLFHTRSVYMQKTFFYVKRILHLTEKISQEKCLHVWYKISNFQITTRWFTS